MWVCRACQALIYAPVIKVEPDIFSETVGAMDMYKEHFQGKTISVQGFVFRDGHMNEDTFAVSRFLVMSLHGRRRTVRGSCAGHESCVVR